MRCTKRTILKSEKSDNYHKCPVCQKSENHFTFMSHYSGFRVGFFSLHPELHRLKANGLYLQSPGSSGSDCGYYTNTSSTTGKIA